MTEDGVEGHARERDAGMMLKAGRDPAGARRIASSISATEPTLRPPTRQTH
ncbi:MAG: hypothetical protein LC774_09185 [Acidobacteria bacterium]|nr:hypothetical protein [Acidobacteriota bacterium]